VKRCTTCKINKKNSEFYNNPSRKDKLHNECILCLNIRSKKSQLKNRYNLTIEQKDNLILQQNNCCAICGEKFVSSKHTHVDHCHKTNKIRKILCTSCNTGLGCFNDDQERLKKAIDYLEYHAKENTATPIPTRPNKKSKDNTQLGTIPTTGAGEDGDNIDHHSGTVRRQNADHSPKASSSDGVGYRNKQVATSQQLNLFKNIRQ
jgi:hypothetical protein